MASFDIVSKVDLQTEIELDKKALSIRISTEDNMKLEAIEKILLERSSKQQIDVKSYDLSQEPQPSGKLIARVLSSRFQ